MKSAYFCALLYVITHVVQSEAVLNEFNKFLYNGEYNFLNKSECKGTHKQFFKLEKNSTTQNCNSVECDVSFKKIECVSETESVFFPKCCPPKHFYETVEHKCINSSSLDDDTIYNDLNLEVSLIKCGLESCKVIVDYFVEKSDFLHPDVINIDLDRSLFYRNRSYVYGSYCFDKVMDSVEYVVRLCHDEEFCKRKMKGDAKGVRCIRKCCPDGQIFVGTVCAPRAGHGLPLSSQGDVIRNANETFAVLVSDYFLKFIADKKNYNFTVDENGSFIRYVNGQVKNYNVNENMYCMETFNGHDGSFFMRAYHNTKDKINYKINRVVLVLSCIFLVLTILAFTLIRKLRNFLGKVIVCYCISLFASFATIAAMQFNPVAGHYCVVAGYVITFSFLAAFTWTTLISYDIWNVLGSMTTLHGKSKRKECRKLFFFNLIGWSVPALITGFMALDNQYQMLPYSIHPYIGLTKCLVEKHRDGNYAYFLYITGPCGILILINIAIYVKTISYIFAVKREIDRIKFKGEKQTKIKIFAADKERVITVLKLFLVMGVNWTLDVLTSVIDFKQDATLQVIEIIFDIFNGLQGVFIFCIFVLKKKILRDFLQKLGFKRLLLSEETNNRTLTEAM